MISEPRFSHPPSSEPPDGSEGWHVDGADPLADDPLARLGAQFSELKAYAWQRWAARLDRVSLEVRRAVVLAALGAVALLAAAAGVVTAVVLLLSGAAGGVAQLVGGRLWLANLMVSAATLGLVAVVFAVVYAGWARASRRKAKEKYERRSQEQRRRFGHSAADRAAGGPVRGGNGPGDTGRGGTSRG